MLARQEPSTIPRLVRRLRSRDDQVLVDAAGNLCAIAMQGEGAAAVAAAGAVPALLQLMDSSRGSSQMRGMTCSLAATVLGHIAGTPGAHAVLMQAGALPAIVRGIVDSCSPTDKLTAVLLAAAVLDAGNPRRAECRDALEAAGAVPVLVRLLFSDLRDAAAGALSGLVAGDCEAAARLKAAAVAAGAVPALASALEGNAPLGGREGAVLLAHLASGGTGCQAAIVAAGLVPQLVQLLGSGDAGQRRAAVGTLHSLAEGRAEARLEAMAAARAAPALRRLLSDPDADEQLKAQAQAVVSMLTSPESPAGQPVAPAGSSSAPAASQPSRPRPPGPRVCAAPGCGATRGLRFCGGCGMVRYCSTACSRAHWREHRAECRRLQAEQAAAAAAAAVPPTAPV